MKTSFINQLFGFIVTPFGLIGIAIGILLLIKAQHDRPTGWLLFSICCFASSLDTFKSRWYPTPPLVFPLQQMRSFGRPLALVLLAILIVAALQTQHNWRRWILPPAVKYLMAVQLAIFAKTILYGSQEFAWLSALTFGGVIFMLHRGPGRWLQDDENFMLAVRSISIAGAIFIVFNIYQFVLNRSAVTFVGSRFLGTTGNPQTAGLLLASIVPCLIFSIQRARAWSAAKYWWVGIFLVTLYFLLLTGSRTGFLMTAVSIFLFYRSNGGAWLRVGFGLAVLAALIGTFLQPETLASSAGIDSTLSDRFTSTSNSRESVWNGMLESFLKNIIFGAPLEGGRLGYGENTWLAVASNLGLIGLIPMLMVGWESIKLMWQLNQLSNRDAYYFFPSSVVIAGIGSILTGACLEASLLGNISFSVLVFLAYLIMGGYLLEVDRVRTYYAMTEAQSVDRDGIYQ
jgi:hypothetical protein